MHEYYEEDHQVDTLGDALVQASSINIDAELSNLRPERYGREKDWMEPVVDKVDAELRAGPTEHIIRHAAELAVWQREEQAARRLNKFLRDMRTTGQMTLWWDDPEQRREVLLPMLALPLATTDWRIRFGIAEPEDLHRWSFQVGKERDERRDLEREEENVVNDLAELLERGGYLRVDAAL